jgi:hypothetical protein
MTLNGIYLMEYYKNFIQTLSTHFIDGLNTIKTEYNFDYGDEFELTLCHLLNRILPHEFGTVRGHIVSMKNETAGDDLVIFKKSRFPTLALRPKGDISRKEFIPAEAAYCYIETKHTINILGNDEQSLAKACQQVSNAKKLIQTREVRDGTHISKYININPGQGMSLKMPEDFPNFVNPAYGIIIARNVRIERNGSVISDPYELLSNLTKLNITISSELSPDLIVLGDSVIILPALNKNGEKVLRSPFYIEGRSGLHVQCVPNKSYGIAIAMLMQALDWIELGVMPWHKIVVNGLNIPE